MVTWAIKSMMVKKQDAGKADVVYLVDWLATGADEVNEARKGGTTEVPLSDNFTPYGELTEPQVLSWVWAAMGNEAKISIEANLESQLIYMQNPPDVSPPLPWG